MTRQNYVLYIKKVTRLKYYKNDTEGNVFINHFPQDSTHPCNEVSPKLYKSVYNPSSLTVFTTPSHSFQCQLLCPVVTFKFQLGTEITWLTVSSFAGTRMSMFLLMAWTVNKTSHKFTYCPCLLYLWTSTTPSTLAHLSSIFAFNQQPFTSKSHTLPSNSAFHVICPNPL